MNSVDVVLKKISKVAFGTLVCFDNCTFGSPAHIKTTTYHNFVCISRDYLNINY